VNHYPRFLLATILPIFLASASFATDSHCGDSLLEHGPEEIARLAALEPRGFQTSSLPALNEETERRVFEMLRRLLRVVGYRPSADSPTTTVLAPACGAFGEARGLNYALGSGDFGVPDPTVQLHAFDVWMPELERGLAYLSGGQGTLPDYVRLYQIDARKMGVYGVLPESVDVGWIRHPDSRYDHVPVPGYPKLLRPMFRDTFARVRPGGVMILTHVMASEQMLMSKIVKEIGLSGNLRTFVNPWGEPIPSLPGQTWDRYVTAIVKSAD
jgi:hypothetical protein